MTVHYATRLVLGDLDHRDEMEVMQDLCATYGPYSLTVPAGTIVNGANIPRLLWRVAGPPMRGPWLRPSVLHDAGYTGELQLRDMGGDTLDPCKLWVDRMFRDALLTEGISRIRAWTMYRAVRIGGRGHWE